MSRHINLPKEDWKLLRPDEREILEFFDERLPIEWEMYIKPHLNGLQPDVVFLNPWAGIAVFNIIKSDQIIGNPLERIQFYKEEILKLYCPGLKARFGNKGAAAITAGLIFTRVPQARLDSYSLFSDRYPRYYPIVSSDSLVAGDLNMLFPEWRKWGKHNPSYLMSQGTGNDLRRWLEEPDFSQMQRNPLRLNARQREIAETRTEIFYRRVKGSAGSGKSQALAARAAVVASKNKSVLVCSYNITLRHYLHSIAHRHATSLPQVFRLKIDFLNFHDWCKRICFLSGNGNAYKPLQQILGAKSSSETEKEKVWNDEVSTLVQQIYKEMSTTKSIEQVKTVAELEQIYGDSLVNETSLPYYDAILVDEGQDFTLPWWQTIEKALLPNGEMLFVADTTQNIYRRNFALLEQEMQTGGFRGPWFELGPSYRLPSRLITILQRFADEFLDEDVDIPHPAQEELNLDVRLRWVQMPSKILIDDCPEKAASICFKELQSLRENSRISDVDITFLSPTHKIGRAFVKKCTDSNVPVHHIFGKDEEDIRNKKLDFRLEDTRIKATTLHSFKGLESRHLIIYVNSITREDEPALFYTALTRLKKYYQGSCCLTVVSSCRELEGFGSEWEDFERIFL